MKLKTPKSVIKAHDISQLRFRDTPFVKLMNKRIYNVLMVASRYDMFMLEDDGRVDEQIFNEYVSLNLRYPPRFTQVNRSPSTGTTNGNGWIVSSTALPTFTPPPFYCLSVPTGSSR